MELGSDVLAGTFSFNDYFGPHEVAGLLKLHIKETNRPIISSDMDELVRSIAGKPLIQFRANSS